VFLIGVLVLVWYKFDSLFSLITWWVLLVVWWGFYLIKHKNFIEYLWEKTENFKNRLTQKIVIKYKKRLWFKWYNK
jgi:hypothetical protein